MITLRKPVRNICCGLIVKSWKGIKDYYHWAYSTIANAYIKGVKSVVALVAGKMARSVFIWLVARVLLVRRDCNGKVPLNRWNRLRSPRYCSRATSRPVRDAWPQVWSLS